MLHIPILRQGKPYESVDKVQLVDHATGEPVALVSQANSGMVARDVRRMADDSLERLSVCELTAICKRAAKRFISGTLPVGDQTQTFDEYIGQLSATTGMPWSYCRANAQKLYRVLAEMDRILAGLTRGMDLSILDTGYGSDNGRTLSYFRAGRIFGAVLPSNSPGVHGLWLPAIALKAPIVLKPGREEPWTPYRLIEALAAEGIPREALGFYPTDHAGAGELLRCVDRSMLFGGSATTAPWQNDSRVELHGPGFSKVVLGEDAADNWEKHIDVIAGSIAANGGRSCINASGVWTPRNAEAIADALAERFAKVAPLPVDHPEATIAAFATAATAQSISEAIDHDLKTDGSIDVTQQRRGSPRLVHRGRVAYLLPTIIRCDDRDHALANREFLFPFASVVTCETGQMAEAIGPSLVVSAITSDESLIRSLMSSANIDRLNIGAIPTYQLSWDQPHEGNLFEHLYRRRALQIEPAA